MSKEIASKWYLQAKHDLEIAAKNIGIGGYDTCAFLCQQAVEKLLKAVITKRGGIIPRVHYLDDLSRTMTLPEDIQGHLIDLTSDYTLARYPDVSDQMPFEMYTKELATEKLAAAKSVFQYFHGELSQLEGK